MIDNGILPIYALRGTLDAGASTRMCGALGGRGYEESDQRLVNGSS
jgi:hypothetical protein